MGWVIAGQRLAWEENGVLEYPTAEKIYELRGQYTKGEYEKNISMGLPDNMGIRFARVGAQIVIQIDFDKETNHIYIKILAQKGSIIQEMDYSNGYLPDSIIINGVWYNLLSNCDEVHDLLQKANVQRSGKISLGQYIRVLKQAKNYTGIQMKDNAGIFLSNHPGKKDRGGTPVALKANLYPYQQTGYHWMKFIADEQVGCILGDEMGLGKTLQVIALITDRRVEAETPVLVIAPVSLLENWRRELDKFTTGMSVYIHYGPHRTGVFTELLKFDVVIISYHTASSDLSLLRMINWDMIIVDEAQNIKNPIAQRTRSIKRIPHKMAIAVTGTPFENHISDLWSIMDFIVPGFLGKLSEFETVYTDDIYGARMFEPILSPLMLRRRVAEVAQDLPRKIAVPQILQMNFEEARLYEEERERIICDFGGKNASLPMLQKLRMFCTHPALLNSEKVTDPVINSSKYQRLCELMEELVLLNEKVILFTSYNKMIEILKDDIPFRFGIRVLAINGSIPSKERQTVIDEFSGIKGSALLVLNPRAAGAGLNITAATRVIHYNLEWNPALEDQASARAYRRGQTKTVFIYRLYYKGTVEEVINERLERKREMSDIAVIGVDGNSENSEDILKALYISPGEEDHGKQTDCNNKSTQYE